ncbi:MAG: hypothetical protein V3T16_09060, partial [Gemmatimonadales bacterium]
QRREEAGMFRLVPLDGKLVRGPDDQLVVVEGDRLGGFEPGLDRVIGDFLSRVLQDALPCFFGSQLHLCSKNVVGWSQGRAR